MTTVGHKSAFTLELTIPVTNQVSVELVPVTQNPLISAIEVLYAGTSPPTVPVAPVAPPPTAAPFAPPAVLYAVRYNIGSTADWTDPFGQLWKKDILTLGSKTSVFCGNDPIMGTTLDTLYCSNRWFAPTNAGASPYLISIPVTQAGTFRVRLHFAELVSCVSLVFIRPRLARRKRFTNFSTHDMFQLCNSPSLRPVAEFLTFGFRVH